MSTVILNIEDHLGVITLNRPEAFNSVDADLARELIAALDACDQNPKIRAILLTGSGKAFCAGQDLKEITDDSSNPGFERLLEDRYKPIVTRLRTMELPIVAAVNGVAAGAGANFALACDIVVATESASFIQAFSAIGLIPDSAGTFTLPRAVGFGKATALAMLGDKVSAAEAERMGMIYKVFPAVEFESAAREIAVRLSTMPTKGLALTKKAFNASMHNTFEAQLELENELQIAAANTADFNEGVSAFVEKRKPTFTGN